MNIWVVRQTCLYDNESYVTSHLTEKGALITAIKQVREDMCDGFDEDELEDYRPGLPHNPEEDLMQYDSCLLYTSPSPRDATLSRMPSSA